MNTNENISGKLFELYAKDVRLALERYGVHRNHVEDLLQEVFLIATYAYDPALPERPWLLKTAYHVSLNFRALARHRHEIFSDAPEPPDERSPEWCMAEAETRNRIHQVIDTLAPDLREIFVLAELENIPQSEIAVLLKIPPGTVQSRLRRARKAFFKEGRRRQARGELLAVLALLQDKEESRFGAAVGRSLQLAGAAVLGGAIVFAFTRPEPPKTPIQPDPATIADTRSIVDTVPAVVHVQHPARVDLVPALSRAQPFPADDDAAARDEAMLMERAGMAINQKRYGEALRILERHKRTYPRGRMSATRDEYANRARQLSGMQESP